MPFRNPILRLLIVSGSNGRYLKLFASGVGPIMEYRPADVVGHTIQAGSMTVDSAGAQPNVHFTSPGEDGGSISQLFLQGQNGAVASLATLQAVGAGGKVQIVADTVEISGTTVTLGTTTVVNATQLGTPAASTVSAAASGFDSTASITYTNIPNNPGIAFVAPPSGIVLVLFASACASDTAAIGSFASFDMKTGNTVGAGVSVYAANDGERIGDNSNVGTAYGRGVVKTGLNAGSDYNVRMMYRRNGGAGNAGFASRSIIVIPLLA